MYSYLLPERETAMLTAINLLLDRAVQLQEYDRICLLLIVGEQLHELPRDHPSVQEARERCTALALRYADHLLVPAQQRPQPSVDPRSLIPAEELTLLAQAVDDALALAAEQQRATGRRKILRGLRESRAWKDAEWGEALTLYWLWALRQYDVWTN